MLTTALSWTSFGRPGRAVGGTPTAPLALPRNRNGLPRPLRTPTVFAFALWLAALASLALPAAAPGHGGGGLEPGGGGGQPKRSECLRRELERQQRLPVRRRRGRGAHAQEPGHGRRGVHPVRGGGEPERGERLRRELRQQQQQ